MEYQGGGIECGSFKRKEHNGGENFSDGMKKKKGTVTRGDNFKSTERSAN